jgi:hypothetical protein
MNYKQKQALDDMIQAYNTVDTTSTIRETKHSDSIRKDLIVFEKYKMVLNEKELKNACSFLWKHYPDIFTRLYTNSMDMNIMNQFISLLSKIEDGSIDQHQASYQVGMILKKIYIEPKIEPTHIKPTKNISWKEFKLKQKD